MISQTATPFDLLQKPDEDALVKAFAGSHVDTLRTPAMIIDRKIFAHNCAAMHKKAREWGATFRAHLKTHKTLKGTRLQLQSSEGQSHAIIVSTMMEAWEVFQGGLVADGTVKDILYGLPIAPNKIADLSRLSQEVEKHGGVVRILIDHPDQVRFLEEYNDGQHNTRWSAFIKINGGQHRAGVVPSSKEFFKLLDAALYSPVLTLYGFYGHAGNAYGSTSLEEASNFLSGEVQAVNIAAQDALQVISKADKPVSVKGEFVLSVGSTPTAHAASAETRRLLSEKLNGVLELHAGNYPMLDLQQEHTSLIDQARISQRVRATVISYYPGRGTNGTDEAMVDAGAIAFSKDTGPSGGYGEVIGTPWKLSRISQEHGILTIPPGDHRTLALGTVVDIIGQHACLIAAAYPWYYIVDSDVENGTRVVDVWVPWKALVMSFHDGDGDATELIETYDFLMKYIIIGEAGTGKSCLLHQFTHNSFKDHSQHTIGVEFSSRTVKLGEKRIKLQLWDTAGQERFRSVTRSYYRGAAGAILVYDITNRNSFANLSRWLSDARALASSNLVVVLVGNKSDREEDREVEWSEASRWAADNGKSTQLFSYLYR
ncbi:hypothetical protein CVT24_005180 [Panaeolus cyanescens]|uniref:D-serine dehydratase n=1 Tax=Panaeolus cyanescens TaxID=181874 RepID=A0A409Y9K6_9AGAR|nr:hypothetical protein CVT24_005180 [Panaeolus cyanescens]